LFWSCFRNWGQKSPLITYEVTRVLGGLARIWDEDQISIFYDIVLLQECTLERSHMEKPRGPRPLCHCGVDTVRVEIGREARTRCCGNMGEGVHKMGPRKP
jgi:hypothetical protein